MLTPNLVLLEANECGTSSCSSCAASCSCVQHPTPWPERITTVAFLHLGGGGLCACAGAHTWGCSSCGCVQLRPKTYALASGMNHTRTWGCSSFVLSSMPQSTPRPVTRATSTGAGSSSQVYCHKLPVLIRATVVRRVRWLGWVVLRGCRQTAKGTMQADRN